jgi:hypothetical protein
MLGNYRVDAQLVASRVVLSSIELVSVSYLNGYHLTNKNTEQGETFNIMPELIQGRQRFRFFPLMPVSMETGCKK